MNPYQLIGWMWIALLAIWILSSLYTKRTVQKQTSGSRLVQVSLGLMAGVLIWGGIWSGPQLLPSSLPVGWIGLALTVAGIALALWARFELGTNWSAAVAIKQNHELVRSGPYRVVRHPIYSGFLLALLGAVLARGTASAMLGLVLVAATLPIKSRSEEVFMAQQFGSQYTEYTRGTKALIPFLW